MWQVKQLRMFGILVSQDQIGRFCNSLSAGISRLSRFSSNKGFQWLRQPQRLLTWFFICCIGPCQVIVRGNYHENGEPADDACARCLKICRQILCLDWREALTRLADSSDPLSGLWAEVEANLDSWPEDDDVTELPNPIRVPSNIKNMTGICETSYFEVGFLSEPEFLRFVGASPATLKAPIEERLAEDGVTTIRGVYIPLRDLPTSMSIGDILSLRKVRFEFHRGLDQHEILLSGVGPGPNKQVHPVQGQAMRKSACQKLVAHRIKELQISSLMSLPTLSSWAEKANLIESSRQSKEKLAAEKAGQRQPDP